MNKVEFSGDVFDFAPRTPKKKKVKGNRYRKPRFTKSKIVKYRYAVDAVKELSEPILNKEEIIMLLDGSFIFGDFIEAFLVENNLLCKSLTISTLGMSKDNIDSLNNLLVGNYLEKLVIHVSDYYYAHNRQNVKYIYEKLDIGGRDFQLVVSSNHTKIVLMELEDRNICMHGSMNLRSSDCIEQLSITHNQEVYNFFNETFKDLEKLYYTIKKSVRNRDLSKIFKE